ncbi:translation initiation factor IF-2 subunit alpha [Candidatus Micrarchaeota archaeon]|nr:translation initiation factor IF-2 subunit alpha [Candidatus Micrarchaeota archaeon]
MNDYPENDEYTIAKAKKILPYGAIVSLQEYGNREAFIHVSEVFSGWVRNIREHVKEGQVIVVKVISVDQSKHQVDVSLKRVSESDKKRKMLQHQQQNRAQKMLEAASKKLGKSMSVAAVEVQQPLEEKYGGLYAGFEAISQGKCEAKLPKSWLGVLEEFAKREIKPKIAKVRAVLTLKSFAPNGLQKIKEVIASLEGSAKKVRILYVSAPTYYVDVEADSYKQAEKTVAQLAKDLQSLASGSELEASLEIAKA